MKNFNLLKFLASDIDKAFEAFYETMLKDEKLSIFFESEEQVKQLIEKQKQFFIISLESSSQTAKMTYTKLGELHYDLRIPYVDFMKGTSILKEHFLLHIQKYDNVENLIKEIFEYFKIMSSYTAKGYLNKMIEEDKRDIENFFKQNISDETIIPQEILSKKFLWLKRLIYSIEKKESFNLTLNDELFYNWFESVEILSDEKKTFFEDLKKRIVINIQNLFYFLENDDYSEILPLYSSLLNIYKLILMMKDTLTVEYANNIIEKMKLDSLTQLYRKDLFEDILSKEINLLEVNKQSTSLSLIFIDIDDFKTINDKYGHYTGDKVIEKFGEIIKKNIRSSDIGFRIGGDEFALILKDANLNTANKVAMKISHNMSSHKFIFNDNISFFTSLSIGIHEIKKENKESISSIIKSVDKKLYISKRNGKNQITL